jgi:YD repeat-containing protein
MDNDGIKRLFIMKKLFIFIFLSTSILQAQSLVRFRIAANGKVEINAGINQGALPFFTPAYATDSVSKVVYKTNNAEKQEQAKQFIGSGSYLNFTHYTISSQGASSIYPIIKQWESDYYHWTQNKPGTWRLEYGRSVYSGCGSHTRAQNSAYYQEWHLDKNNRVKKITAGAMQHDTVRKKMPVTTFAYQYDQSGKIIRQTVKAGSGRDDRSSEITEFVYDKEGHLIAQCEYQGQRSIKHLPDSVVAWKRQLEYIIQHGNKVNHFFEGGKNTVYTLHFYTYENHLLLSTLRYSNFADRIETDSLSYDNHGNLTRLSTRTVNSWFEFTFAYDTAGEKLLSRREYWHSDCADRGCTETIFHENYSYDPSGKISKILYESESKFYPEAITEEFFYSTKRE